MGMCLQVPLVGSCKNRIEDLAFRLLNGLIPRAKKVYVWYSNYSNPNRGVFRPHAMTYQLLDHSSLMAREQFSMSDMQCCLWRTWKKNTTMHAGWILSQKGKKYPMPWLRSSYWSLQCDATKAREDDSDLRWLTLPSPRTGHILPRLCSRLAQFFSGSFRKMIDLLVVRFGTSQKHSGIVMSWEQKKERDRDHRKWLSPNIYNINIRSNTSTLSATPTSFSFPSITRNLKWNCSTSSASVPCAQVIPHWWLDWPHSLLTVWGRSRGRWAHPVLPKRGLLRPLHGSRSGSWRGRWTIGPNIREELLTPVL